jgi:hypothetical protein
MYAQQLNSGAVNGTVSDPSGAVMPNVKVTATSPALQGEATFETTAQGEYRFPALPLGVYRFSFEAPGFATQVRDQVTVSLNFAATLNITMTPATQAETVVVTAEVPLVDTQNTNITAGFTKAQLEDVPTGRDMWSVLGLMPGVLNQTLDVGGSAVGNQVTYSSYGYGGNNRVMIDGINTSEGTSGAGFYFDYGSFTEFTVGTAANDASMPVPGNAVNAVIKTGGNEFHGTTYFDYEAASFQGSNISDDQLKQGVGLGQRLARYYDINGDVGGPIKRDKLWFYTSIRDQANGKTVTGFPVQAPGTVNSYAYDRNATYKVTYALSPNHRISNYIQWNPILKPQRNSQAGYYEDAMYYQKAAAWVGNVQYTGTFGPKLVTTILVGTWGYNFPTVPYGVFPGDPGTPSCPCAQTLPPIPVGQIAPRMLEQTSGNTAGGQLLGRTNPRRYQFEPTASYFLDNFLHANHQIKFGYVYELESTHDESYAGGAGVQQETFKSAIGAPDFSTPYQVIINNNPRWQLNRMRHNGAYVTDQVKVNKRTTLNIGVRWDSYTSFYADEELRPDCLFCGYFYKGQPLYPGGPTLPVTPYANGTIPGATTSTLPHQIAPRIGLAIDLTGKGRTVLNLNWGQYYTNMARNLASGANPLQSATATFTWNNPNNLPFNVNQLGAIVGTPSVATANIIDPNLRDPRMDDMGAIIQHQVNNSLSIRGGFVFRELFHDFQTYNAAQDNSLFTLPVPVKINGPQYGINGNTTDFQTVTLWDIPKAQIPATSNNITTTPDGNKQIFRNWEVTINKRMSNRWSLIGNFTWTRTTSQIGNASSSGAFFLSSTGTVTNGTATNPDMLYNARQSYNQWTSHVDGTYTAKWGIRITPTLRMQEGLPITETFAVTGLNVGTIYLPVAPTGAYRNPDLYVFDTRFEKDFKIKERFRINGFVDLFNIFNSNAANVVGSVIGVGTTKISAPGNPLDGTTSTYQKFLAPTTVLPPRVMRLGVRFTF